LLGLSFAFLKALELPRHPEMITSTQSWGEQLMIFVNLSYQHFSYYVHLLHKMIHPKQHHINKLCNHRVNISQKLSISYKGNIRQQSTGFFRSLHSHDNNAFRLYHNAPAWWAPGFLRSSIFLTSW
jgi:hypothetical protein